MNYASQDPRCHGVHGIEVAPDGFVLLVNMMGDDEFIAQCARIGRPSDNPWPNLLRYMMANKHTSPFEFGVLVFHVRLPIFVARQWMRHRMGTFNEWSARYMELPDRFWQPHKWRRQAKKNRQGSEGEMEYHRAKWATIGGTKSSYRTAEEIAFDEYHYRLQEGVAREQARSCLPVSIYTEFYWKVDLHNLMNFLLLRSDMHAQQEIREYADALIIIFSQTFPETYKLWLRYSKYAVTLTADEIAILKGETVSFTTQGEMDDAKEKLVASGLIVTTNLENPPWKLVQPPHTTETDWSNTQVRETIAKAKDDALHRTGMSTDRQPCNNPECKTCKGSGGHVRLKCTDPNCTGNCTLCNLFCCEICKGAENSLPTQCPGFAMTSELQAKVSSGTADYKNDKWHYLPAPRKP